MFLTLFNRLEFKMPHGRWVNRRNVRKIYRLAGGEVTRPAGKDKGRRYTEERGIRNKSLMTLVLKPQQMTARVL
jgi:hypothetical protein